MVYAPRRPGTGLHYGRKRIGETKRFGCHYCNEHAPGTLDHIVPLALGGANAGWNIVAACEACNSAKGSDWPTCKCDKCAYAVARFLRDESLRIRAAGHLRNRVGHLTDGIEAKRLQIEELEARRAATIETIALLDAG